MSKQIISWFHHNKLKSPKRRKLIRKKQDKGLVIQNEKEDDEKLTSRCQSF
jgi:hypothetical protein